MRPPPRAHHIDALTDDQGLAFTLGLTTLPKATHLAPTPTGCTVPRISA
ncbi:hypothetical protein ACIA5D_13560 [Actinoplanes sp. NPDC051513]